MRFTVSLKAKIRVVTGKQHKGQIRLWSTSNPLENFLKDSPAKCLQNRLQEKTIPPKRARMINSASSRRTQLGSQAPRRTWQLVNPLGKNQKAKGDQGVTRKEDLHVAMATAQELQIRYSRPPVHHVSSLEAPKPSTAVPGPSKLPGTSTNNLPPQCHLFQYLNGRYLRLAHSLRVEMG